MRLVIEIDGVSLDELKKDLESNLNCKFKEIEALFYDDHPILYKRYLKDEKNINLFDSSTCKLSNNKGIKYYIAAGSVAIFRVKNANKDKNHTTKQ